MVEPTSKNRGVALGAIILIGLGILMLMDLSLLWPMFILVPGLVFLGAAAVGGRSASALAIPGMLITGTGALLFLQNLTNYWDSWSYAWTLYGVFLGAGLLFMGRALNDRSLQSVGQGCMFAGIIGFGVFAFLMEIVIGVGGGGLGAAVWPWLFIGVGVILILRNIVGVRALQSGSKRKRKHAEEPLFVGPIVYGSRSRASGASRLSTPDEESGTRHRE